MYTRLTYFGAMLAIGVAVAGGMGYFFYLGDLLSALVFGFLPTLAICGGIWGGHHLFAAEPD
jgi:hypothetical protein